MIYQWQDGDALMLGRNVMADGEPVLKTTCIASFGTRATQSFYSCLMRPLHSAPDAECVWVPESKLTPYPSEPIPEPLSSPDRQNIDESCGPVCREALRMARSEAVPVNASEATGGAK